MHSTAYWSVVRIPAKQGSEISPADARMTGGSCVSVRWHAAVAQVSRMSSENRGARRRHRRPSSGGSSGSSGSGGSGVGTTAARELEKAARSIAEVGRGVGRWLEGVLRRVDSEDHQQRFVEVFDLEPHELLVADYACAAYHKVLLQGRMYVSLNFLCF